MEWEWWDDLPTRVLFLTILLLTNHSSKKWRRMTIQSGQLITSRNQLSTNSGLTPQQVRTSLKKLSSLSTNKLFEANQPQNGFLKSTSEITIKTTNKFTVITINNWNNYQISTNKSTNKQPTTNQQLTTNNNDKNDNNKEREREASPLYLQKIPEQDIEKFTRYYKVSRAQIINKAESLSLWLIKKGKAYKNYKAALQDCLLRDYGRIPEKKHDIFDLVPD